MSHVCNRATWIWKTAEVICDAGQIDQFVGFAQRNGINRVYVHINPDVPHQDLANFISNCAGSIAVEALMGDPAWIRNPETHQSLQLRLRWVEDFQRRYAHDARLLIQGLHLDIEPWQLDEWRGPSQPEVIRQWIGCVQVLKSWADAQLPPLPVTADLPFWLHTLLYPDNKQRLDLVMMSILDGAVFMTYRNTPQGLIDIASEALQSGWECRKRREMVYLAVETVPSEEGSHISYHGMRAGKLHSDIGCLESGHGLRRRRDHETWFGGLAVHDYHTWVAMEG
ncbi:hypothetical protein BU23DRAFT_548821 [Bimuria novae-zelandiae CBS 107.79]|uniref:Uncharacterized protein n=1 Tax=Bimuria novae-zelandiae CBS 107.79 TaxID=1447943 RepID=A0A6A5VV49_9PLEO|nr:hypothetical protein BU23DRAFT_548821 [Bimuria novae-zelandiae CBS 107.79]